MPTANAFTTPKVATTAESAGSQWIDYRNPLVRRLFSVIEAALRRT